VGGELLYLDSSALVKLILPEAESVALDLDARGTDEILGYEEVASLR
jgi:hypothetical protein